MYIQEICKIKPQSCSMKHVDFSDKVYTLQTNSFEVLRNTQC